MFMLGTTLFLMPSPLCGLSWTGDVLIARVLQADGELPGRGLARDELAEMAEDGVVADRIIDRLEVIHVGDDAGHLGYW
jgi:hypothetical protein